MKLVASVALALGLVSSAAAQGNTGSGGTIVYTDPNGNNPVSSPPYVGGFVVHIFTASGTLILPSAVDSTNLVVAGGGGGGGQYGDGGGAGGLIYTNLMLNAGSYSVTIGAGGTGASGNADGANGNSSVFSTLTALGGGGGGDGYPNNIAGLNGGSGGGSGGNGGAASAGAATQPSSPDGGFGNAGFNGDTANPIVYGGGGGAGAAASSSDGGNGLQYSISGVSAYYAGGGAGIPAGDNVGNGTGGLGGGGNGGNNGPGSSGTANTGGGGGGGWGANGASGGSGIVIVQYPYVAGVPVSISLTSPTNGQEGISSSPISATAFLEGGTPPYTVTYYANAVGSAPAVVGSATSAPYTASFLEPVGNYQIYATVTDGNSSTAKSGTNSFTVFVAGNSGIGGTITYTDPNGLNPVSGPPYVGGYVVDTFTTNGTLVIPSAANASVLVVAGGGGAGGEYGDGGGAGGLVYSNLSLNAGAYNVTVGTGGIGGGGGQGGNGVNSVFGTLIALGGGGGGNGYDGDSFVANLPGESGGSGGGSGGDGTASAGTGTQPSSPSGGFGNGGDTGGSSIYGGGGGAGAAATNSAGGNGLPYAISGVTTYYAGGGGGIAAGDSVGQGAGGLGGGGAGAPGTGPGTAGAANTGGGGGAGWDSPSSPGGSGVVIVRYPYVANPSPLVVLTSPANGQAFDMVSSISATAAAVGGTAPYTVTYHYKLASAASYTATTPIGPFGDTTNFAQTLSVSPLGAYQVYATATDSSSQTSTSATNTFTVGLTVTIPVQDASFETGGDLTNAGWTSIADVWNPAGLYGPGNQYEQNSLGTVGAWFTYTTDGGVSYAFIDTTNTVQITQDLLTNVTAGDTLSMTFYGGQGVAQSGGGAGGGVFTASFLVGSTAYSTNVDTTVLAPDTWQGYTLTETVTNSGELMLQFTSVSGNSWLDNISSVALSPPLPQFSGINVSGKSLTLTATNGAPGEPWALLETTNLALPLSQWTTYKTGNCDANGDVSTNLANAATNSREFFILK